MNTAWALVTVLRTTRTLAPSRAAASAFAAMESGSVRIGSRRIETALLPAGSVNRQGLGLALAVGEREGRVRSLFSELEGRQVFPSMPWVDERGSRRGAQGGGHEERVTADREMALHEVAEEFGHVRVARVRLVDDEKASGERGATQVRPFDLEPGEQRLVDGADRGRCREEFS